MKTAKDFIKDIKPNAGNLSHIITTGDINGTLLIDIEKAMKEYARQWIHETAKSLHESHDCPPAETLFYIYNRIDAQ